jgi:hypothetical protein
MAKSTKRIAGLTILINPNECPSCRREGTISKDRRQCRKCHAHLLKPDDNFAQVGRDAITAFWVFFPLHSVSKSRRGWCHSDHLDTPAPIEDTRPIDIRPVKPNEGRPRDPRVRFTGERMLGS